MARDDGYTAACYCLLPQAKASFSLQNGYREKEAVGGARWHKYYFMLNFPIWESNGNIGKFKPVPVLYEYVSQWILELHWQKRRLWFYDFFVSSLFKFI